MLVKKSVLNEIDKEGTFTQLKVSKTRRNWKGQHINIQTIFKFTDKVNC